MFVILSNYRLGQNVGEDKRSSLFVEKANSDSFSNVDYKGQCFKHENTAKCNRDLGPNSQHFIFFETCKWAHEARVIVTVKSLQPSVV